MSTATPLWTAREAAVATGGKAVGAWSAYGVSIDTRTIEAGDLFVALKGERDGHEFVAAALEKKAAAAVIAVRPGNVAPDAPLLIVGDTQAGLENLGRASRARSRAKIVAVTGSAGKTTTKEMLRLMLAACGTVAASAASYNNHWGVPLSLARMGRNTTYGVFEIGMNHAGEIRALVKQVRPHVALITTVAPAHLEYFGSVEAIADAKAEIFEGLESGGTAILPAGNPQFARLKTRAQAVGVARILSFGTEPGADARLIASEPHGEGQKLIAAILGERVSFSVSAAGAHIAMNAVAGLLALRELGADVNAGARTLAGFAALKGRGARLAMGGIELIDESYNANPASMAAALDLLGQTQPKTKGRRIAVLGDMLELGQNSAELHRGLADAITAAGADLVFLCGPQMAALWQATPLRMRGAYAETSSSLAPELMSRLRSSDVVLVKGSFGSRMSVIIDALKTRQAATA
ncbi:MAG TPA: UDP-N-acetylmuramoylalanyl-D-glutamyl-2,6-diaminopimelate--D-alanyl-D-alanine ligase [Micropepsaceae bacterium]|nr:UDP-N-acetylmuramoylalanyl-D-glutamyl-2,6-diaminopimelate--D-alanyl-D-alanine ligase [Micropepsaceae bacterium]